MAINFSKAKQHRQKFGSAKDFNSPDSISIAKGIDKGLQNIDAWAEQISFWRTHLDVFLEDVFSDDEHVVRFFPFQAMKLRSIGNDSYVIDDESRGLGKTYIAAWAAIGLSVLYPGCLVICVSGSGKQSTLIPRNIERIMNNYKNVQREISECKIQMDRATIRFHNGSEVIAMAMGRDGDGIRGQRSKVVFIDEGLLVKSKPINDAVKPTGNYNRPIVSELIAKGHKDYQDFPSKIIETSSACYKFEEHFERFKQTTIDMMTGKPAFTCALSYQLGLHHGIQSESVIEEAKRNNTAEGFAMEYNARFIGTEQSGVFSYEVVSNARKAETIELSQPEKKTKYRYILSADIATSQSKTGDNAVVCVVKFSERKDGTFFKRLVYMRSYHGVDLTGLANEIRRTCIAFPAIEAVIVDINGIGEGIPALLELPYIDPETGIEYPSFVTMDTDCTDINAIPIVYPYRGNNEMNNRGTTALKMYLENNTLSLPVQSSMVRSKFETNGVTKESRLREAAVFKDVDALVFELMNIRSFVTTTSVRYGVRKGLHKDRYSSLMMACYYLFELEQENKREKITNNSGRSSGAVVINYRR